MVIRLWFHCHLHALHLCLLLLLVSFATFFMAVNFWIFLCFMQHWLTLLSQLMFEITNDHIMKTNWLKDDNPLLFLYNNEKWIQNKTTNCSCYINIFPFVYAYFFIFIFFVFVLSEIINIFRNFTHTFHTIQF